MEITTTKIDQLKWEMEGSGVFAVSLENNKITSLSMCEVGTDTSKCLHSTDEKHLRNLNKALTSLFSFIDRQHERPETLTTTQPMEIYTEQGQAAS